MRSSSLLSPEFLAEIRRLQIQMRRNTHQSLAGEYRSTFRGSGMEFEEVREYVPGDEIRRIDWKVTARFQKPYVKSYREERELQVIIAVDVSPSTWTGTRSALRKDLLLKGAAALATIALTNGDKVGLLTFSDRVLRFRKPEKSRNATWRMLHEILGDELEAKHEAAKTDVAGALQFLGQVLKRRAVIFLLSDFFAADYAEDFRLLTKRHDITAVTVRDPADFDLPRSGYTRLRDPESGEEVLVNCSRPRVRAKYRELALTREKARRESFNQIGLSSLEISTTDSLVRELVKYFRSRMAKQKHRAALRLERQHGG